MIQIFQDVEKWDTSSFEKALRLEASLQLSEEIANMMITNHQITGKNRMEISIHMIL